MFNKIKRYRKRYPKYKIVFLEPQVALHTQRETIDKKGYRIAQRASECEEITKVIQEKEAEKKYIVHNDVYGIFSVVVYEENCLQEYTVGDFWDMRVHLNLKRKMGASVSTNFYLICIKKNTYTTLSLSIAIVRKTITRLSRMIRQHTRRFQPIF